MTKNMCRPTCVIVGVLFTSIFEHQCFTR